MPTARQNMPSAVLDGTIWVPGGLEPGAKGSRKVEGYDPVINAWKAGPDLPVALHHEMAVPYKDELVVIGGWIPKGDNPSGEVSDRVFALRGGSWVELPSLNRARAAGAAAVVGDRIVVVGGQADDRLVPTTEVFDGKRWTTAADIPTPREHLAAASDGRFLYAVGGRDLSPDKNSAALERFDPQATAGSACPACRPPAAASARRSPAGGSFAIGGETATDVMGKVESYDIGAQVVVERPHDAHPAPRDHGHRDRAHRLRAGRRHPPRPRDRGADGGGAARRALSVLCGGLAALERID